MGNSAPKHDELVELFCSCSAEAGSLAGSATVVTVEAAPGIAEADSFGVAAATAAEPDERDDPDELDALDLSDLSEGRRGIDWSSCANLEAVSLVSAGAGPAVAAEPVGGIPTRGGSGIGAPVVSAIAAGVGSAVAGPARGKAA